MSAQKNSRIDFISKKFLKIQECEIHRVFRNLDQ